MSEVEHDGLGRNETSLERSDRNLVELLQEVRVAQTGIQVLFGFLLMAPLTIGFKRLGSTLKAEYFATLLLAAAGAMLLIAPTAYHRALFRLGDKEYFIRVANRLTIAGLFAVGLAMVGSIVFVAGILLPEAAAIATGIVACCACAVLWAVLPLIRRQQAGDAPEPGGSGTNSRTNPSYRAAEGRRRRPQTRGPRGSDQRQSAS